MCFHLGHAGGVGADDGRWAVILHPHLDHEPTAQADQDFFMLQQAKVVVIIALDISHQMRPQPRAAGRRNVAGPVVGAQHNLQLLAAFQHLAQLFLQGEVVALVPRK